VPFEPHRSRAARIAGRAVRLRCPRCGRTPLFQGWFRMARECATCGLRFERAQGYFVGAIYINYGVSAVIALGGFFLLWAAFDLTPGRQLAVWVPFVVLFPLWFFRYSRSLWLALEYFLNPEP
jgi:uncharacterized protein (DUF983 family)